MNYLTGIKSSTIDLIWDSCVPFIELASQKGQEEMSIEDIYDKCKEKSMQLWVVFNDEEKILAVVTTEIANYPRKKVCRIVTLGGEDMINWVDCISIIEEWAIENNCVAMETFCRKGFKKQLKDFGYEETYIVLGKELTTVH